MLLYYSSPRIESASLPAVLEANYDVLSIIALAPWPANYIVLSSIVFLRSLAKFEIDPTERSPCNGPPTMLLYAKLYKVSVIGTSSFVTKDYGLVWLFSGS